MVEDAAPGADCRVPMAISRTTTKVSSPMPRKSIRLRPGEAGCGDDAGEGKDAGRLTDAAFAKGCGLPLAWRTVVPAPGGKAERHCQHCACPRKLFAPHCGHLTRCPSDPPFDAILKPS